MAELALDASIFLIGLLVGNRLAILRDKRREYNEATRPFRKWIIKELERPTGAHRPSEIEISEVEALLPPWKRRRFRAVVAKDYEERRAVECQDSFGGSYYSDTSEIKPNLRRLWKLVRKR